jgi:hypothetical protein
MLQSGHGLSSKRSPAKSATHETRRALAKANAPAAALAVNHSAPQPAMESSLESRGEASPIAAGGVSRILSQPVATFDAEIARGQAPRGETDILQRENLVRLAVISVPTSPGIPDTQSAAVEERSVADHAPAMTATQAKKIRAEIKTHATARHRHRPQKHVPPSLLAKIGQSVKKGLIQAAKFPQQAMAGHLWD